MLHITRVHEYTTIYPHTCTSVYSLPIYDFLFTFLIIWRIFLVWKSKLHITRVYEYTTFNNMSFTTPYIPHLFIQIWCKQRVELVTVFWHYQSFSNNLFIFLSGAFKAEDKIDMRYPFLRYSTFSHNDISCFLWYECTTDDLYPSFIHPGLM